jgi:DNA-binding FrmR family transcriptional regulator
MTTHAHGYYENKDRVLNRLKRAEGQVRGVARMVEEDKYCIDVLTQVGAVQAALDKVAVELIREHAKHCLTHITDKTEQNTKADELANAVGRMLSS